MADAVGYMTMGSVFAANMTGNTVLAGIAIAQGGWLDAWRHLAPLVAFFAGAMISRLLLRLLRAPTAGLIVEAALLAGLRILPLRPAGAAPIVAPALGIHAPARTHFPPSPAR